MNPSHFRRRVTTSGVNHLRKAGILTLLLACRLYAETDYYPLAHQALLQAEPACFSIARVADRGDCLNRLVSELARAGYLTDAKRISSRIPASSGWDRIGLAQAVYLDLPTALETLHSLPEKPIDKTSTWIALVDILWRLQKPADTQRVMILARDSLKDIVEPAKRKTQEQIVQQMQEAIAGPPPHTLSPSPSPVPELPKLRYPFPMTIQGFRKPDSTRAAKRQAEDAPFLERIYSLIAAHKLDEAMEEMASAPEAQKMIGFATIEHLALQSGFLDQAEMAVAAMPEDHADYNLAKAEAWAAVALADARAGRDSKCISYFGNARICVQSTDKSLAFGRAVVTSEIAAKQFEAGYVGESQDSFRKSVELSQEVPALPQPGRRSRELYREDAYREILIRELRARDLGSAREIARQWDLLRPESASGEIVTTWVKNGRAEDASAYSATLSSKNSQAHAFLAIAFELLKIEGAPEF